MIVMFTSPKVLTKNPVGVSRATCCQDDLWKDRKFTSWKRYQVQYCGWLQNCHVCYFASEQSIAGTFILMSLYSLHNSSSRLFPKHSVGWSPDLCSIVKHSRSATVISNSGWKEATVTHNSWLSDRSLERKTHYYRYMLFPPERMTYWSTFCVVQ